MTSVNVFQIHLLVLLIWTLSAKTCSSQENATTQESSTENNTTTEENTTTEKKHTTIEKKHTTTQDYCDSEMNTTKCVKASNCKFRSWFIPTFCYIICFLGVTGNTLAVLSCLYSPIFHHKKRRTYAVYGFLNMSLADLFFSMCLPFWAANSVSDWAFGQVVCKVMQTIYKLSFYSSMLWMSCISMYKSILFKDVKNISKINLFKSPGCKVSPVICVICVIWIMALVFSAPEIMYTTINNQTCSPYTGSSEPLHAAYSIQMSQLVLGFTIPVLFLGFYYFTISKEAHRSKIPAFKQLKKFAFVEVAVFLLSQVPYNVVLLLATLDIGGIVDYKQESNLFCATDVTQCVAFLRCCLNPVVFIFNRQTFRNDLIKLLRAMGCCGRRRSSAEARVYMNQMQYKDKDTCGTKQTAEGATLYKDTCSTRQNPEKSWVCMNQEQFKDTCGTRLNSAEAWVCMNQEQLDIYGPELVPDCPLADADWKEMKETSSNPQRFDVQMMSSLLKYRADLDIAKSLLTFVVNETDTLSYELLVNYLMVCEKGGHDTEVSDVYEMMCARFPSLETAASSLFIKSFSKTERWREALIILQNINKVSLPSPCNYSEVITGAVTHGDSATAWALYDELTNKGISPDQDTWEVLFRGGLREAEQEGSEGPGSVSQSEQQERLLGILHNMRNNQVYPQQRLVSTIKTWFESLPGQKWKGSWPTITTKGVCKYCGSALESIQLTTEEYQRLKDVVMTNILQGKDVFKKTTPEEFTMFKEFVKQKPAFSVVIDGLNVANITTKGKQSEALLAVVSELERQGQVVLVLCREHMLEPSRSWDQHDMCFIRQKAHCFFIDNFSEDDPFVLYAALHSGNHCRFLSSDLMRDHKACLPDSGSRHLFFKWHRGHQLVVDGCITPNRKVCFQSVPGYDTIVQSGDNTWHIPFDDSDEERTSYEVPQRWLCLTKTNKTVHVGRTVHSLQLDSCISTP